MAMGHPRKLAWCLLFTTTAVCSCVDECVLSGAPCDSTEDCQKGQLCRMQRGFEAFCIFAKGICSEVECGSVADCGDGQCCDAQSNRCIDHVDFSGSCDTYTCRVCPECAFDYCSPKDCLVDADCANSKKCVNAICRKVCNYDSDCPDAICSSETCSAKWGAPCAQDSDCAGLNCLSTTPAGAAREGYCSDDCDEEKPCPEGYFFVCDDYCKMP